MLLFFFNRRITTNTTNNDVWQPNTIEDWSSCEGEERRPIGMVADRHPEHEAHRPEEEQHGDPEEREVHHSLRGIKDRFPEEQTLAHNINT